jgi:hypothetical protein
MFLIFALLSGLFSSFPPPSFGFAAVHSLRRQRTRQSPLRAGPRLAAISEEVQALLSEFGVVESERQEELVSRLSPLIGKDSSRTTVPLTSSEEQEVQVSVVRGDGGGLGIEVDSSNTVGSNSGGVNPALLVGDRIIAVDGVPLDGNYVGQRLSPSEGSFTFTVVRGGESAALGLEKVLLLLAREAEEQAGRFGLSVFAAGEAVGAGAPERGGRGFDAFASRVEEVVRSLETAGAGAGGECGESELMLGYWKLVYSSDKSFVSPQGGLTRQGARPLCRLVGHWQCLQTTGPNRMQTVEMIQNLNLGTHAVAALKGDWALGGGARAAVINEAYERLEYAGALENTERVENANTCTYLGEDVRVLRSFEGAGRERPPLHVYVRRSAKEVGAEIKEWLASPVPGVAAVQPRWDGYGIAPGGPSPSASAI